MRCRRNAQVHSTPSLAHPRNRGLGLIRRKVVSQSMSQDLDSEEYEYYIIHDRIGVSRILRRPKGVHPEIRCAGCDD